MERGRKIHTYISTLASIHSLTHSHMQYTIHTIRIHMSQGAKLSSYHRPKRKKKDDDGIAHIVQSKRIQQHSRG